MTKQEYTELVNKLLEDTEKTDKDKLAWQTRNHLPMLHQSLAEFYRWLVKNKILR